MFTRVLCAVDLGTGTPKIIRHAAGIAAASGARLSLVHVTSETATLADEQDVSRAFFDAVPYAAGYVAEPEVNVVAGGRAEAILREAQRSNADLIVAGTRGHNRVGGWLLGSTTRALLEATTIPVLLIPATDIDIVTLAPERADLNFGAVIAAIDFAEHHETQLQLASEVARLAHQHLILLTVLAPSDPRTDHDAAQALHARAHRLTPVRAHAVIVRRGDVDDEIGRCASAESAGLVVMGLRQRTRGRRPGLIASAVMQMQRPAVLAVPDAAPS